MSGYFRMRRDLSLPIAPAPLPAGIILLPFSKETTNAARELMKRVYPEGLNDGGISFEGFWTWLTTDAEFDRDLMFFAARHGVVVGLCHCWRDNFVKDLAVDPSFRKSGLGSALLTTALLAYRGRKAASVDLKTDIGNATAQSLYRRLGFVIVERVDEP